MSLESMELVDFLEMEEVDAIRKLTRDNFELACILEKAGLMKVTQPFSSAEALEGAFEESPDPIDVEFIEMQMDEIRSRVELIVEDAEMMEKLKSLLDTKWIYSRYDHPVLRLLEEVISKWEGAEDTAVFNAGLAAIEAVLIHETTAPKPGPNNEYIPGGKIVVISNVYGGTVAQCADACEKFGRQYVQMTTEQFLENGLPDDAQVCFFESSCNPMMDIAPFEEIVKEANRLGIKTVCDATFAPGSIKPLEHGVDYVVHSLTKYFGGRSRHTGGSLSSKNKDDIQAVRAIKSGRRMLGGTHMDIMVGKDFLEDAQDLPDRLWLATKGARAVKEVFTSYDLSVRVIDNMAGYDKYRNEAWPENVTNGMIAVDFGSKQMARRFCNEMYREGCGDLAVSLGSVDTLYSRPRGTTHSELSEEKLDEMGITEGIVRISCGIEKNLLQKVEVVLERMFPSNKVEVVLERMFPSNLV